jgi:hypothetical protein
MSDVITQSDLLTLIARQKSLNFEPRSKYLYSNSNFTLLSEIVRRVSGMSLNMFANENIFKPLGMTNTFFRERYDSIIPSRAMSYMDCWDGTFLWKPLNFSNEGATSLHSTASDLLRWLSNYSKPVICKPETIDIMLTVPKLISNNTTNYACGIAVHFHGDEVRGERIKIISHSGADEGYRAHVLVVPDEELEIVILSNVENIILDAAAKQIVDIVLNRDVDNNQDLGEFHAGLFKDINECLDDYCGLYMANEWGYIVEIIKKDEDHIVKVDEKKTKLRHLKGNCYEALGTPIKAYICDTEIRISTNKITDTKLIKLTQPKFSDDDLINIPGIYFSHETESYFEILCSNGDLIMRHKRFGRNKILLAGDDVFVCPLEYTIRFSFVKNDLGIVKAIKVSGSRIMGIEFNKVIL